LYHLLRTIHSSSTQKGCGNKSFQDLS
jgi:hypothetical protein